MSYLLWTVFRTSSSLNYYDSLIDSDVSEIKMTFAFVNGKSGVQNGVIFSQLQNYFPCELPFSHEDVHILQNLLINSLPFGIMTPQQNVISATLVS